MDAVTVLPLVATAFALPQLAPQLVRLHRTGDVAGVSLSWAGLTAASNLGWIAYFVTTGLWSATFPSSVSTVIALLICLRLVRLGVPARSGLPVAAGWLGLLASALLVGGPLVLGSLLTVAFLLQVSPSLRSAWASPDPSGVSRTTWLLIGAEVVCWGTVGMLEARLPLIALGVSGVAASGLMLWLSRPGRPTAGRPVPTSPAPA